MIGSIYECECEHDYHKGAIFTVELGSLIENGFDIGLKDYPIFDENYRAGLNAKIIEHYYFREIGQETPGLFKRFLNRRMNEIMPYYNQLYRSTLYDLNPFSNYDMWTQSESSGTSDTAQQTNRSEESNATSKENATSQGATTTENDNDTTARTLVSATPQMQLSGREDYATNITDSSSKAHAEGTSEQNSTATTDTTSNSQSTGNANGTMNARTTDEYLTHVSGLSGITQSQALMQFRETFLNIDRLILDELADLFMGLYTDYWNAL